MSQLRQGLAGFLIFILLGSYFLRGVWLPHLAETKHRNLYVVVALLVFFAGLWLAIFLGHTPEDE